MNRLNISKSLKSFNKFYNKSLYNFSYQARVKNYDLSVFEKFKTSDNLTISELSNVARVISDPLVLKRLEDSSLPLINQADETDLRKIASAFLSNTTSENFVEALRNRYKHFHPEKPIETLASKNLGLSMRFYIFLYHQRKYYLAFFRFFGINLK